MDGDKFDINQKLNITCAECQKVTTLSDIYTNGDGPGRCRDCAERLYTTGNYATCAPIIGGLFTDVGR